MLVPLDKLCTITIYSHFFKITDINVVLTKYIYRFCLKYVIRDLVRIRNESPIMKITTIFSTRVKDGSEYRFHIGQLEPFMNHLKENYMDHDRIEFIKEEMYTPVSIVTKLRDKWKYRPEQEDARKFILDKFNYNDQSRLITMPTGTGKTLLGTGVSAEIGKRIAIFILPKYIDKWVIDIATYLEADKKEVMVVTGGDRLRGLIEMGNNGTYDYKYLIISLNTLQNFYKSYLEGHDEYGCKPEDLCKLLGIGTLIFDEIHQFIHAIYTTLTFTHVPKIIGLSATFLSDNKTIDEIHRIMFPREIRFDKIKMKKYIKAYAIAYNFQNFQSLKLKTKEFRSNVYSHTSFEKSIIKNRSVLPKYLDLIKYLIDISYIAEYKEGDKAIIFCATVKLCGIVVEFLKLAYPNKDIRRYAEDDPYENIIEPDIRVTTILSGGTAIDIPNLRVSILTVSIKSPQANIQTLGRLREIKDRSVKFYYIYCVNIPKQVEYHRMKMDLIGEKVATLTELNYPRLL